MAQLDVQQKLEILADAAKYDASVSKETEDSVEAYADWRREGPDVRVPSPWPIS